MESIILLGLNLNAWITIATVLSLFTILLFTKLRADLVFLGAISILFLAGVLDAKETFAGFSSSSVVVIGVLFVVFTFAPPQIPLFQDPLTGTYGV